MNLYRYHPEQIQTGVDQLLAYFRDQQPNWIEQGQWIAELKFRDDSGTYWFYDLFINQWYFAEDNKWILSSRTPSVLEGLTPLFPGELGSPKISMENREPDATPAADSPQKTLQESLQLIHDQYWQGVLGSNDAEEIARRYYLIDLEGQFWTVGLQTGSWYRRSTDSWVAEEAPPGVDQLVKLEREETCHECGESLQGEIQCQHCGQENPPNLPELSDQAYGNIIEFLVQNHPLPESITTPWNPPDGFPTSLANPFTNKPARATHCPQCGQVLTTTQNFCTECGAEIKP